MGVSSLYRTIATHTHRLRAHIAAELQYSCFQPLAFVISRLCVCIGQEPKHVFVHCTSGTLAPGHVYTYLRTLYKVMISNIKTQAVPEFE